MIDFFACFYDNEWFIIILSVWMKISSKFSISSIKGINTLSKLVKVCNKTHTSFDSDLYLFSSKGKGFTNGKSLYSFVF